MLIPSWFVVGFLSVLIGVIGSFFDKYLLKKYFSSDDDSGDGAGALIIFSAFFLYAMLPFLLIFGEEYIDFRLDVGMVGFVSGMLSCLWILLYLHALSRVDVSQAVPVFQTVPIFGLLLGFLFFGEILTGTQLIAAATILLGSHVLLSNPNQDSNLGRATLLLMLGSSFFIALSQVIFKVAAVEINFWSALFWNWVGFVFLGLILYIAVKSYRLQFKSLLRQRVSALKRIYGVSAVNEVFDITSDALLLGAVILGPVALVQSINAYEPFMTLLFGFFLVKLIPQYFESDFTRATLQQKIVGILIITIGSLILYSSF